MHKVQDKPAQAAEVLKFFDWSYKNGEKMADELDYVPLPDSLVKLIRASWGQIKDASGKPVSLSSNCWSAMHLRCGTRLERVFATLSSKILRLCTTIRMTAE